MNIRLRKFENLHVLLWLIKDLCWLMEFKLFGVIMILPTLTAALWLTYHSRSERVELLHNIAVTLWIIANGNWMVAEFYFNDENKIYSAPIFVIGLIVLALYYVPLIWKRNELDK
jgi:hypothetical protein